VFHEAQPTSSRHQHAALCVEIRFVKNAQNV